MKYLQGYYLKAVRFDMQEWLKKKEPLRRPVLDIKVER